MSILGVQRNQKRIPLSRCEICGYTDHCKLIEINGTIKTLCLQCRNLERTRLLKRIKNEHSKSSNYERTYDTKCNKNIIKNFG